MRRPSGITVADVFRATNGAITKPGSGEPARGTADYDHNGFLVINAVWKEAETHFMEYLESVTIEDLCENAKHGMKSEVLGPMGRFKETLKKA